MSQTLYDGKRKKVARLAVTLYLLQMPVAATNYRRYLILPWVLIRFRTLRIW